MELAKSTLDKNRDGIYFFICNFIRLSENALYQFEYKC